MDSYLTPFGPGRAELIEKRSRFIGEVYRVESEEQARVRLEEVRTELYDARHHCWCYILRSGGTTRYSDDGEPQGTAGLPMLNVFQREDVTDVLCVVTRYFGGILLGTGGLTRAYGGTAKLALDASGICRMGLWASLEVPCPYALYERMKLLAERSGGVVENTDFGAEVTLYLSFPAENVEKFQSECAELSAGQLDIRTVGTEFRPGPKIR